MGAMSARTTIAWNTGSQLAGKLFATGSLFLINILVARVLGVTAYGEFTKVLTFVAPFYLLADFGINAVYLQKKYSWETLFFLRATWSLVLTAAAWGILWLLPAGQGGGYTQFVRAGIVLFLPAIFLQGVITSANAYFQKRLRYDVAMVSVILGSLLLLGICLPAFRLPESSALTVILAGILAGTGLTAVSAFLGVRKLGGSARFRPRPGDMKKLFFASTPIALILIFNLIYFRIDNFILILTRPTTEVGIYGLAYKIFETVLVVPTFFMNAVYPLFLSRSGESAGRQVVFRRTVKTALAGLFLLSLNALVVVWFLSPLLVLLRPEFRQSTGALRVLAIGFPFFFVSSGVMWALIARKKQKILALLYGISMIINIALNILFIPDYGFMAAAWITVISEAMVLLVSALLLLPLVRQSNIGENLSTHF